MLARVPLKDTRRPVPEWRNLTNVDVQDSSYSFGMTKQGKISAHRKYRNACRFEYRKLISYLMGEKS